VRPSLPTGTGLPRAAQFGFRVWASKRRVSCRSSSTGKRGISSRGREIEVSVLTLLARHAIPRL